MKTDTGQSAVECRIDARMDGPGIQLLRCKADGMALLLKRLKPAAPGSYQALRRAILQEESNLASLHARRAEALADAGKNITRQPAVLADEV